ncbi:hypothetical protein BKG89_01105 [Rodentibacter caecimuris]|uniref:Uncharacterized protein n=1 Tax=Rodentibacter caecimuris TaxID=1796644 RepID=A0ABX3KZT2_9PAST|nr:hypothetical protein BKG89_01105 [Rodentibacter heylii]
MIEITILHHKQIKTNISKNQHFQDFFGIKISFCEQDLIFEKISSINLIKEVSFKCFHLHGEKNEYLTI